MFKKLLLFTFFTSVKFFKLHKFSMFVSVASIFDFISCLLALGWLLAKEDLLYEFKYVVKGVTVEVVDTDLHSLILKV